MAIPANVTSPPYVVEHGTVLASATFTTSPVRVASAAGVTVVIQGDTSDNVDFVVEESLDGTNWWPMDDSNVGGISETGADWSGDGLIAGSKIMFRQSVSPKVAGSAAQRLDAPPTVYIRVRITNQAGLAAITDLVVAILAFEG